MPYIHDSVDMVRHHNEIVDSHVTEPVWQPFPDMTHHFPSSAQAHLAIVDLSKQEFPSLGYDRYEVRPLLAVIIAI